MQDQVSAACLFSPFPLVAHSIHGAEKRKAKGAQNSFIKHMFQGAQKAGDQKVEYRVADSCVVRNGVWNPGTFCFLNNHNFLALLEAGISYGGVLWDQHSEFLDVVLFL